MRVDARYVGPVAADARPLLIIIIEGEPLIILLIIVIDVHGDAASRFLNIEL